MRTRTVGWVGLAALTWGAVACTKPALDYRRSFTVADVQAARGFDWVRDSVGPFRLYAEAGSGPAERLEEVKSELGDEVLPRIRELIGRGIPGDPVHVFLLEDGSAMRRLVGWSGVAFANQEFIFHQLPDSRRRLGAHEFVHVATARHFGPLEGFGAYALSEGVAVYASGGWQGRPLHPLTKHLRATGHGLTLRELLTEGRSHPSTVTYPQAGSFVAFLHERFGAEKLAQLLERQYPSSEPRFEAVLGADLAALEAEWDALVERADASGIEYSP